MAALHKQPRQCQVPHQRHNKPHPATTTTTTLEYKTGHLYDCNTISSLSLIPQRLTMTIPQRCDNPTASNMTAKDVMTPESSLQFTNSTFQLRRVMLIQEIFPYRYNTPAQWTKMNPSKSDFTFHLHCGRSCVLVLCLFCRLFFLCLKKEHAQSGDICAVRWSYSYLHGVNLCVY